MAAKDAMMCPACAIPMNRHAEKVVEPRNAQEARQMDAALGGMVEEFHTCPGCGKVAERASK